MKVVFINALYAPNEIGGAERSVRAMAEKLVASGGEAVVISLSPDGVAGTGTVNGVRVHYVPLANVGFLHGKIPLSKSRRMIWHLIDSYNPIMGARVKKILRQERPDVVETNNLQGFSVAAWRAARSLGLPVVQVLRDYYLACANSTMYRNDKNCAGQCASCKVLAIPRRRLSSIPDAVASVSRRTLEKVCGAGMFRADIPKIVGRSAIKINNTSSNRAVHAAGAPLTVGFLGRIEPVKGIESLLEAVTSIDAGKIRLVIAGGGDPHYVDQVKARFGAPNIDFLGVTDPAALFDKIDILFVPSIWEDPLPRVMPEAYANGLPIAVARVGGMPEIVDEGVTGYIFEPGNAESIKALLLRLIGLEFPTAQQLQAIRGKIDDFRLDTVFGRHFDLWQSVRNKGAG